MDAALELAEVYFRRGEIDQAIETQHAALTAAAPGDRDQLQQTLNQ